MPAGRRYGSGVELTFYGVRGSCPCAGDRYRRVGGNTSCALVTVEGEPPLILDLGTGLRAMGDAMGPGLRAEGRPLLEAVSLACRVRLRPVLMTSLATLIGLIPLAAKLGTGSEAYAPLAQAIIGGLAVSVVLTVFIVPCAYYMIYRHRGVGDSANDPAPPPGATQSA